MKLVDQFAKTCNAALWWAILNVQEHVHQARPMQIVALVEVGDEPLAESREAPGGRIKTP